jgi:hypothetical protein
MFNPVIIVAIILQSFISRASKVAGAIAGYVLTTGIMIWGISVYSDGNQIAFFGAPLPEEIFVILCLVWYGFDTKEFLNAKKAEAKESENKEALLDPAAREAWAATWKLWKEGQYSPTAQTEASKLTLDAFVNGYMMKCGRLMAQAIRQRPLEAGEFVVGVTTKANLDDFLLTNRTLYLFTKDNPIPNPAIVIPLREIDDYRFNTQGTGRVIIKLRSGQIIDHKMNSAPKQDILNKFRDAARATSTWGMASGSQIDIGATAR